MNVFLLFVIIAAVCGSYYLFSCWRFPRVPCAWCKGKAPRDPLLRKPFGECGHCGGTGWKYRWGARLTGSRGRKDITRRGKR